MISEALLHVDAAALVKVDLAALHDALDGGLCGGVEPAPRVAGRDVAVQVEVRAAEAGLDVAGEAGGQARVEPAGEGRVGEERFPAGAGQEERCGVLAMG